MRGRNSWILGVLLLAVLMLAACSESTAAESGGGEPAIVEKVDGSETARVILSAKAAARLGVQTAPVRSADPQTQGSDGQQLVIPYAAVLYGKNGETWAYTNPEPLVFVRRRIVVDHIQGDLAVLIEGPEVGMPVVTVGAIELFGAEIGVGH